MNNQSPHPELDPRLTYSSIYFQPTHPEYNHSVLRMLSYALSSDLNNYHNLLKYHGIIIAEISKTGGEEDKEQLAIENSSVKSKKAAFTKQKNKLVLQIKNEDKIVAQQSEIVLRGQESYQTYNTIISNQNPEPQNIIQNIEIIESQGHARQRRKVDKKQKCSDNLDLSLIEQPKFLKFGVETNQLQRIRENLLMRQVQKFPIRHRLSGLSREMRSLCN